MRATQSLRSRAFIGPYALTWFYRRWLRVHAAEELLAGLGVAIAVALVFATIVAAGSIAGSASEIVHAVVGPASLQLHARGSNGFPESLLRRVERLQGVKLAAPLLEQTATVTSTTGASATVDLAGADTSLVVLDGLAHTLPRATLTAGGIGLSAKTAEAIGARGQGKVFLALRGVRHRLPVSAVLGPEAFGALSQATVAVMPLAQLQRLAGFRGRISRVLVQTKPGQRTSVRKQLRALAGGKIDVAAANEDVSLLRQALRPSDQASSFFAAISALLGLLLAAGALLLTAPERRRAVAELRLIGTKRSAIAQMFLFQALLLGAIASLVGLLAGYGLSRGLFHQSPRYLAEAFTLGTQTVLSSKPLFIALLVGLLATCLASTVPLLDLRSGGPLDAIYREDGVPGNALGHRARRWFGVAAGALLIAASALFATTPGLALLACALLALATVLATPLALAGVLRAGRTVSERKQTLTMLPVALSSLRATTLRSLALAATGAVALFGSVALGGARSDLMSGISRFAHSYSSDADIWVGSEGDNQAVVPFRGSGVAQRLQRIPGVSSVESFRGGFLQLHGRRVWVIARPPRWDRRVFETQIVAGEPSAALRQLRRGGSTAVSRQIAEEHHIGIGGRLTLPTPSGASSFTVAALTTNLAWSPGVVFLGAADYRRLWPASSPTAFGVKLAAGVDPARARQAIIRALGPDSGLTASTAHERELSINSLTSEGLNQLDEISLLLLIAAILAMAAALTSAIWQRRASLAGLRLSGVSPPRLRRILLLESSLMLGAGCVTGALAGVYGQAVIDRYLAHVTGFPVAVLAASARPLAIFALVVIVVLLIASGPALIASRVSPRLAFNE